MTLEKEKAMYIHMATAFTVLLIFSSGRLIVTFACHAILPEVVATYYLLLQFVAAKDQPLSISWSKSRQPRELDLIFKSCQPRRNDNAQSYHAIYGGRIPPKKRSCTSCSVFETPTKFLLMSVSFTRLKTISELCLILCR